MEKKVIGIEYTVKDTNTGETVDSNVGGAPLEFISGNEMIIIGLEDAIVGEEVGSKLDVTVEPKDGYGEVNEDAIQTLPKEQFADVELVEGMSLYGTGEDGQTVQVIVTGFTDEEVTIDYNHPLAGKTLMFTVEILSSRELTDEEVQTGVIGGLAAAGAGCGCGAGGCDTHEPEVKEETSGCCGSGHCG